MKEMEGKEIDKSVYSIVISKKRLAELIENIYEKKN